MFFVVCRIQQQQQSAVCGGKGFGGLKTLSEKKMSFVFLSPLFALCAYHRGIKRNMLTEKTKPSASSLVHQLVDVYIYFFGRPLTLCFRCVFYVFSK